ncbi:MAG: T9SS type A sorting domain-containing protein [Chitinophagaceae bacterium]
MSKKLHLSIPKPCHENWDTMTTIEKGKFCGSCQKQVVDFSSMSDREVAVFFKKKSTGSVCGRFMQDQLDRTIDIPRKRIPWVKYFFQFLLPAFLVSCRENMQGKVKVTETEVVAGSKCTPTMGITLTEFDIVPDTTLKNTLEDIVMGTTVVIIPDFITGDVCFQMDKLPLIEKSFSGDTAILKNNSIAEKSLSETIEDSVARSSLPVEDDEYMEPVDSIAAIIVDEDQAETKIPAETATKNLQLTSSSFSLKLFPNPVSPGSTLYIEWKQQEAGTYSLQLVSLSGQLILSKEAVIAEGTSLLNLPMPAVAPGNYFIRIVNKQSGKTFTEKLIIL